MSLTSEQLRGLAVAAEALLWVDDEDEWGEELREAAKQAREDALHMEAVAAHEAARPTAMDKAIARRNADLKPWGVPPIYIP